MGKGAIQNKAIPALREKRVKFQYKRSLTDSALELDLNQLVLVLAPRFTNA